MKSTTCCFTGHRKIKIEEAILKEKLRKEIELAIKNKYTHFISGGALGFDILAAEIIIELKEKYKNITLEIAIPCLDQDKFWSDAQKRRYENVLKKAVAKIIINTKYNDSCMQNRNI